MSKKSSEIAFRNMAKREVWYWHKYGDVRYCIHCKGILPKTERAPDFAVGVSYTYVECKNSDKSGRWNWKEISKGGDRANQREWLLENGGWLFIVLGNGRAPKGKSAYLIPFNVWVTIVEPMLEMAEMSSIRKERYRDRPGGDELMADYRLEWEINQGWTIPNGHVWWKALYNNLLGLTMKYAKRAEAVEHYDL
jgi:hypothetical protein